jgi:hypothetical protein
MTIIITLTTIIIITPEIISKEIINHINRDNKTIIITIRIIITTSIIKIQTIITTIIIKKEHLTINKHKIITLE